MFRSLLRSSPSTFSLSSTSSSLLHSSSSSSSLLSSSSSSLFALSSFSRSLHMTPLRLADTSTPGSSSLILQLTTPHETIVNRKPVYMVSIPSVTGVMGVLADHAPTIAQLKPGIVTVHTNDINDITHKYFVSGGFAIIKPDSTCSVTCVEAVKIEDLDPQVAKKGLDEANADLSKALGEKEKAEAQINQETYEAILQAIEQK